MKALLRSLTVGLALCSALPAAWAQAANYPNRPIRLVVPFGPGGFTDVVARLLGPRARRRLHGDDAHRVVGCLRAAHPQEASI